MSTKRYVAESGEDGKPRRLDQGTIQYLKQIGGELDSLSQGLITDSETGQILVENVLEELKNRTASAACDRTVNSIVEKLCLAASFGGVLELLCRFTPYALFLARNRHSSHILQSTLSRLCFLLKHTGIPEDIDEDDAVTVIIDFLKPIISDFSFAAKDMNATHVVRAALCVLCGLPVVSEKRGKASKHQHSVGLSEPLDSLLLQPDGFLINRSCCFSVPDSFHDLFGTTVIEGILTLSASELQALVVDASGAAVAAFAMRVLFSPGVIEGGADLADRLLRAVLEWRDEEDSIDGPTVFYAMSGERSGSYFLETAMQCCRQDFFLDVAERAVKSRATEYAEDNSANFVLQTILRRLLSAVGGHSNTVEPRVLSLTIDLIEELIGDDAFTMLLSKRGGLLFWIVKIADVLCRVDRSSRDCSLFAPRVVSMLLDRWGVIKSCDKAEGTLAFHVAELSRRLSSSTPEAERKEDKNPAAGTQRDPLQLMTARLIGVVLELDSQETYDSRQLLSRAVASLDSNVLYNIATSGPMSKALLDTIFSAPGEVYNTAREKAMNTLLNRAVDLSCHFVGQHIIKTYYNSSSRPAPREKLIQALVGIDVPGELKERLRRSKEGQGILMLTQADLYVRNRDEWKSSMRKYEQGKSLLRDLDEMKESTKVERPSIKDPVPRVLSAATKLAEKIQNKEEALGADRRKRKRKRAGNKAKSDDADADTNGEADEEALEVVQLACGTMEKEVIEIIQSKKRKITDSDQVVFGDEIATEHDEDTKKEKKSRREEEVKHSASSGHPQKHRDSVNKKVASSRHERSHSSRSDMDLVRNLNSGKLMSKSMLEDTISRLEQEKRAKM